MKSLVYEVAKFVGMKKVKVINLRDQLRQGNEEPGAFLMRWLHMVAKTQAKGQSSSRSNCR